MKTRHNYADAMRLAEQLVEDLRPFCRRIEIAGSLRRNKDTVGDIELLFIPAFEDRQIDMFTTEPMDLAHEELNRWLAAGVMSKREGANGSTAWGAKNKLALHRSGIACDFFSTTEENWWVSLVIRTGGKETNLSLTNGAIAKNMHLNAYGSGFTKLGKVIPCHSEREVFEMAGVPYREPEDRA